MTDDKIIDFASIHDRKHGPAPEFSYRDERGVMWHCFMVEYDDGEDGLVFQIWAHSQNDAIRRVNLIKSSARLSGQIFRQEPST